MLVLETRGRRIVTDHPDQKILIHINITLNAFGVIYMDISKIGIGVVVTIIIQTSAIVWWAAQQASTIENLKSDVEKVTDSVKIERQINLERDVLELKKNIDSLQSQLNKHWDEIQISATTRQIDELQFQINDIFNILNNMSGP